MSSRTWNGDDIPCHVLDISNNELPSAALEIHERSAVARIVVEERCSCYEASQHTAGQLAWAPCRHTDRKHRARHHGYPQGGTAYCSDFDSAHRRTAAIRPTVSRPSAQPHRPNNRCH